MDEDPRKFIKEVLLERISAKAGYSLRSFARDLNISPQQLSNFLNGKRGISEKAALSIARHLHLSDQQKESFCTSVRVHFSRNPERRENAKMRLKQLRENSLTSKHLDLALFKVISNWHHFSLLEMLKLPTQKPRSERLTWYAKRLAISENETRLALSRLEQLKLVTQTTSGWKVNQDVVFADLEIPSEGVRSYHRQILDKASQALSFQNQDERYGSSTSLPVKVKDLPRAKALIQEFREKFSKEITHAKDGEEVYGLSIQFFRLTEKDQERK